MVPIPSNVLSFVQRHLGPIEAARPIGHEHGEGDVWWLTPRSGAAAVVKVGRTRRAYTQERDAYEALRPVVGRWLPPWIGCDDQAGAILLAAVEGRPAAEVMADPARRGALMQEAGRFRRALDRASPGRPDPMPLATAIPKRIAAWRRRAEGVVAADALRRLERLGEEAPAAFAGAARVWCHRDLCPRNWVAPGGGGLVVLDLGQARADAAEVDEVKLWDEVWGRWPDAEAAWADGYGRPRTAVERRRRAILVGLHVVATTVWAVEHGDRALEARGRAGVERLLAAPFSR